VKLLVALVLLAPLAASATIYKWVDEEGRVVYANHEPEASARNVQVMKIPEEPPTPASPTHALEQRVARLEYELQAARQAPAPVPPMPYPASMPPPQTMADYYSPTYGYPGYGYGYPMYGYPVYTYPVYGYRYPHRAPVRVVHHGAGFTRGAMHAAPHMGTRMGTQVGTHMGSGRR
jgi:hypothetical protein